jgi:hypothetical protein
MSVTIGVIQSLVELWHRRHEPEGPDMPRTLSIARSLEADSTAPPYLRSFVWYLVNDVHEAAGWPIPPDQAFPQCHGAAVSVSHGCQLVLNEVTSEVRKAETPVMALGVLAAGRSLFGRWDMLPGRGALLLPLDEDQDQITFTDALVTQQGVRWGHAGSLRKPLLSHSKGATLNTLPVHVPTSELIAARAAIQPTGPSDLETFLFCASAYASVQRGTWDRTVQLAEDIRRNGAPVNAALRLDLADWLGITVPPLTRIRVKVRTLLGANRR